MAFRTLKVLAVHLAEVAHTRYFKILKIFLKILNTEKDWFLSVFPFIIAQGV